jgi:hypothetical protein
MKKPTVKYSKGEIGRVRIVEDIRKSRKGRGNGAPKQGQEAAGSAWPARHPEPYLLPQKCLERVQPPASLSERFRLLNLRASP